MEGHEHTCDFHWAESLQKHTYENVNVNFWNEHVVVVRAWKNSKTTHEAEDSYQVVCD
jgi:hypothetical protein